MKIKNVNVRIERSENGVEVFLTCSKPYINTAWHEDLTSVWELPSGRYDLVFEEIGKSIVKKSEIKVVEKPKFVKKGE